MTPKRLVLNTNIVIDLLKKVPAVVDRLPKDTEALFDLFRRVDMDIDTGRMAGVYASQYAKAFSGSALGDMELFAAG